MPNVQIENYLLFASNEKFNGIWKLTRGLKTAGWRYKASGDATSKDTTGNPANDKWGGGGVVQGPTTVAFTIGAPTTTSFGGRSTLTGLAGFTSAAPGHFLTITGATNSANNGTWLITAFLSATSVVIENPNAVAETTPGTATYTELSALLDTYPVAFQGAGALGAWWCGQGPSTLKIPVGSTTPTGTFIRGEPVTQTTSNATGEFLGFIGDVAGGNGYIVVAPRLSGTGAGVRGWSNSAQITGGRSGATISPTGTVIEFVREVVFWKHNATNGHIYFQTIDSVNESAATTVNGRFSVLATLSQTTATVCPGGATGGNPTTNGFPTTGTFVPLGTGGPGIASTGSNDLYNNIFVVNTGFHQFLIANAIEDSLVSPDGSFTLAAGTPTQSTTTFQGIGFGRVDDQEDGDVDPYVWMVPQSNGAGGFARSRTGGNASTNVGDIFNSGQFGVGQSHFMGWKRRGLSSDSFIEFTGVFLATTYGSGAAVIISNATSVDRVACSFVNISVREPLWIVNPNLGTKFRKGTLRWWYYVPSGAGTDTYDGKRWIQLSSTTSAVVAGPADTTTIPSNS